MPAFVRRSRSDGAMRARRRLWIALAVLGAGLVHQPGGKEGAAAAQGPGAVVSFGQMDTAAGGDEDLNGGVEIFRFEVAVERVDEQDDVRRFGTLGGLPNPVGTPDWQRRGAGSPGRPATATA